MGSKTRRGGKRSSAVELFQRAQRGLEKHDFKQAYKDAKVCYQQEPTPEHRSFLEQAWFCRAQSLFRSGLTQECRDLLQTLVDFGVTQPSLQQELPGLLLAVGLFDQVSSGKGGDAPPVSPELLNVAADRAVIDPSVAPNSLPGIRTGAINVVHALEAVYAGDESQALAALKDLPRSSPFADWKLFLRGLAAYYRRDDVEMRANWDRLDPARSAIKIAAALRLLAEPSAQCAEQNLPSMLYPLEKEVFGEPISGLLSDLQGHLLEDRWKPLLRSLRQSRKSIGRTAPDLLARIDGYLYGMAMRGGDPRRMKDVMAEIAAPSMDPHWHRGSAIFLELSEDSYVDDIEDQWKGYVEDLATMPALSPEERTAAQALVWERIGTLNVENSGEQPDWDEEQDEPPVSNEARAVECLENAIRLEPRLLSAYEHLAAAHVQWHQEAEAASVFRRLLERFPDHFAALEYLFHYHLRRNEGIEARDHARQAWRLKPTSKELVARLWTGHVAAARCHALRGEWEAGRAELTAAEQLPEQPLEAFQLVVRRAILELKAGNDGMGRQLIQQAEAMIEDPPPVLLLLSIEALRYDLGFPLEASAETFQKQWLASLAKRKRFTRTAGRMSELMLSHVLSKTDYPGQKFHLREVVKYVRRCARGRWAADDLFAACNLLQALIEEKENAAEGELLLQLVRRGLKKFPDFAGFQLLAGTLEVAKGPLSCNRRHAYHCFQRARDLAEKSNHPRDVRIAEQARTHLTFLSEAGLDAARPPEGFPLPFFDNPDEDHEFFEDQPARGGSRLPEAFRRHMIDVMTRMAENLGVDPRHAMKDLDKVFAELPPEFRPLPHGGKKGPQGRK
jgi:tetratricopeptide (TPR) repeat protein